MLIVSLTSGVEPRHGIGSLTGDVGPRRGIGSLTGGVGPRRGIVSLTGSVGPRRGIVSLTSGVKSRRDIGSGNKLSPFSFFMLRVLDFFNNCIVPLGFLHGKFGLLFPGESQP